MKPNVIFWVGVLIMAFLMPCILSAQSVSEIKSGKDYYWGEGIGTTPQAAEKQALASVLTMIQVNIKAETKKSTSQTTVDGDASYVEQVEDVLESYSQATLRNTERLEWDEDGKTHVFCYVRRDEVYKIFAERENKIRDFVQIARKAEQRCGIGDALKYYYWALMLLQSHPDGNSLTLEYEGRQENLSVHLPRQIDRLLSGLEFSVVDRQTGSNCTNYQLAVSYRGQAVGNLEYKVHNGRNWGTLVAAKNGIGIAEVFGTEEHKNLQVRMEYEFADEWKTDKEVDDVLSKLEPILFKEASRIFPVNSANKAVKAETANATATTNAAYQAVAPTVQKKAAYTELLAQVQRAIERRDTVSAKQYFTPDGYAMYRKLLYNGNATVCGQPDYMFVPTYKGVQARSLPMRFSFSNRRAFVEQVVFDIDTVSGKISSLSYALDQNVIAAILKHEAWSERSRMAIINFIETYQTAYALKRLDYLESVFSDDALIIVGQVLTPAATIEGRYVPPKVKMNRLDKDTYMKNLARCFRSQEYINLKFADINIVRAGKGGEIYGIQMQQDYFSSSYGDTGYLYLHVDLNDADRPIIHVRTWQPEKDPVVGVYNMGNLGL